MPEVSVPRGPIESEPYRAIRTEVLEQTQPVHEQVLRQALAGVELGGYDEAILVWLAGWESPTVATVASLFLRARALSYEEPEVER